MNFATWFSWALVLLCVGVVWEFEVLPRLREWWCRRRLERVLRRMPFTDEERAAIARALKEDP